MHVMFGVTRYLMPQAASQHSVKLNSQEITLIGIQSVPDSISLPESWVYWVGPDEYCLHTCRRSASTLQ